MSFAGPLLILTMPGFGTETLRRLAALPEWSAQDVKVGLIGSRPPQWRCAAAALRRIIQPAPKRLHALAESTLAARPAETWLRASGLSWCWLADDAAVARHRAQVAPGLTLTITSRVLFSQQSLNATPGDWFNVHPGLLPEYAGAAPGPYMFLDGLGGCTIHRMTRDVDAGTVIDRAPLESALGEDGADYFFGQLPAHTAARVAKVLRLWRTGAAWPEGPSLAPDQLRHCSSARLARDRQLDWRCAAERIARWVAALARIAPAWLDLGQGRRVDVLAASLPPRGPSKVVAEPGTVLAVEGRRLVVACKDGPVALDCRRRAGLAPGRCLPLPCRDTLT